jgi:vancomycin permeability regulator SanA
MKAFVRPTPGPQGNPHCAVQMLLPRGLALFLGGFTLMNILGGLRSSHFDANLWWIDLRILPPAIATFFLLVSSASLVAFAVWPALSPWRRFLTVSCLGMLTVVSVANTAQFYVLLARGTVTPGIPFPLSLLVGTAMATILWAAWRSPLPARRARDLLRIAAVAFACMVCFPLAQMFFFGKTDYRRPADAAVVLGARVYADGRPSDALADRVRTACQLYRQGLVRRLIFSGGPGEGAVHETEAMKRMAMQLGVRAEDIWLDKAGLNTQATVRNTDPLLRQWHASRVLVVSHAYHLPRVKLAYQRGGREVFTVPARESYLLRQMPYNMAREVAALWVYYLRPLANG